MLSIHFNFSYENISYILTVVFYYIVFHYLFKNYNEREAFMN